MQILLAFIDILIIGVTAWFLLQILSRVSRYRIVFSRDLVVIMLAMAYVGPLVLLPSITGPDSYGLVNRSLFWRIESSNTNLLYRVFVGLSIISVYWVGASRRLHSRLVGEDVQVLRSTANHQRLVPNHILIVAANMISWGVLILVPFSVLMSPSPLSYLTYASPHARFSVGSTAMQVHSVISILCLVAIAGFIMILFVEIRRSRRLFTPTLVIAIMLVLAVCYIHGKRSIVFLSFGAAAAIAYLEGAIRVRSLLISGVVFLLFMQLYVMFAKDYVGGSVAGDLFRDYTLLPVIEGAGWTSHAAMPRGAGFIHQWLFWIPRTMWPDKPWPTPVYVTTWILAAEIELDWGFGLGYLEDGLANFGYIGAVCYLAAVIIGCRITDRLIYGRGGSIYAVLWLPITYGCVFAFSVLIKIILFLVLPFLIFGRILTNEKNWNFVDDIDDNLTSDPATTSSIW